MIESLDFTAYTEVQLDALLDTAERCLATSTDPKAVEDFVELILTILREKKARGL